MTKSAAKRICENYTLETGRLLSVIALAVAQGAQI
jgi:hypothetical protein